LRPKTLIHTQINTQEYFSNLLNLLSGMGTRGQWNHQIRVHIHKIMGSQIPVYYSCGYPFNYSSHARDRFYPRIPVDMSIFATPKYVPSITFVKSNMSQSDSK